jgi:hypothetical protein
LLLTHTRLDPSELQILQCCLFQNSQYGHCSVQYSVQSHSNGTVAIQKFVDLPSCVNFPVQKFSNVRKMFCSSEVPTVGVYQSVLLLQLLWSPHVGCLPVSPPPAAPLEPPGPMVDLPVSSSPAAPRDPPAPTLGVGQSLLFLLLLPISVEDEKSPVPSVSLQPFLFNA